MLNSSNHSFQSFDAERWNQYNNQANPRDIGMSRFWIAPLILWIQNRFADRGECKVLDYGCGYFETAQSLAAIFSQVDGYDINQANYEVIRRNPAYDPLKSVLFSSADEIPDRTYDLILLNSVVQYFGSVSEFKRVVSVLRRKLRTNGVLLISDVIPKWPGIKLADAVYSFLQACAAGHGGAMTRHLIRVLRSGSHEELLNLNHDDIAQVADELGLGCRKLQRNLSPTIFRNSYLLEMISI